MNSYKYQHALLLLFRLFTVAIKHLTVQARKRPNSQPYFTTTAHRNDEYAQDDLLIHTSCNCDKHATKTPSFNDFDFSITSSASIPNRAVHKQPLFFGILSQLTRTQRVRKVQQSRGVGRSRGNPSFYLVLLQETMKKKKKERMCHLFNDFHG